MPIAVKARFGCLDLITQLTFAGAVSLSALPLNQFRPSEITIGLNKMIDRVTRSFTDLRQMEGRLM